MKRIPYIEPGEYCPFGLSRFVNGYRFKFPWGWKWGISFDPLGDGLTRGKWRRDVCVRFERGSISMRWGWVLL